MSIAAAQVSYAWRVLRTYRRHYKQLVNRLGQGVHFILPCILSVSALIAAAAVASPVAVAADGDPPTAAATAAFCCTSLARSKASSISKELFPWSRDFASGARPEAGATAAAAAMRPPLAATGLWAPPPLEEAAAAAATPCCLRSLEKKWNNTIHVYEFQTPQFCSCFHQYHLHFVATV